MELVLIAVAISTDLASKPEDKASDFFVRAFSKVVRYLGLVGQQSPRKVQRATHLTSLRRNSVPVSFTPNNGRWGASNLASG
jgi:hypothetical protein